MAALCAGIVRKVAEVPEICRDGDVKRYGICTGNDDLAVPEIYRAAVGLDCDAPLELEFPALGAEGIARRAANDKNPVLDTHCNALPRFDFSLERHPATDRRFDAMDDHIVGQARERLALEPRLAPRKSAVRDGVVERKRTPVVPRLAIRNRMAYDESAERLIIGALPELFRQSPPRLIILALQKKIAALFHHLRCYRLVAAHDRRTSHDRVLVQKDALLLDAAERHRSKPSVPERKRISPLPRLDQREKFHATPAVCGDGILLGRRSWIAGHLVVLPLRTHLGVADRRRKHNRYVE